MPHTPIRQWPASERPREKLIAQGAGRLSDAELLSVFLRTGTAGRSAVALARDTLVHFGGLRGLLCAEPAVFCALPGLGPVKYAQLQAGLELARRHLEETLRRGPALGSPDAVRRFLRRNRVIAFEELFRGTIDGASVHPREVVKRALAHNAAALILAHNHPSGVAEPSQADEVITRRLRSALALVDIRVVDHLVVGDGACVSFAERGLL
ncbi:MAG: JAB domain-containing protein [Gammaproteobacteria bacterium]